MFKSRTIKVLLKHAGKIFAKERKNCKHFGFNNVCEHPDYHRDFALVNICNIKDCPKLRY